MGTKHRPPLGQRKQSALPKGGRAYLSISEYLRKAGAYKTLNVYYRNIVSTHPSVALSENGDAEDIDSVGQGMLEAVLSGDLPRLKFLVAKVQASEVGTCIGERLSCLMLHLSSEMGNVDMMKYLMNDLWVDANACTARGMTAVHYAAKANRVSSIRELAHAGAELDSYNDNGQVPAQMTKDRVIRRLFDKFSAGASDNSRRYMRDYASPRGCRPIDYICILTVHMSAVLRRNGHLSYVGSELQEICRFPEEDHTGVPFPFEGAIADAVISEFEGIQCDQANTTQDDGHGDATAAPYLPRSTGSYTSVLTDGMGRRSYACCRTIGAYTEDYQRRKKATSTSLGANAANDDAIHVEFTARVAVVLSHQKFLGLFSDAVNHVSEMVLSESESWGGLQQWKLDFEEERNQTVSFVMSSYVQLPPPLPSEKIARNIFDQTLTYGDAYAAHSALPYMDDACLCTLFRLLSPSNVMVTLECLLQEQSVLLLADDISVLSPVAESLVGLLYPFEWPHSLLPILPISRAHYLEAPVPFLMGLHRENLGGVPVDLSSIVLVNLCTNRVILPIRPINSLSDLPINSSRDDDVESQQLAEVPASLRDLTIRRIQSCIPRSMSPQVNSDEVGEPVNRAQELFIPGIRVSLVDMLLALIGKYQTFRYAHGAKDRLLHDLPEDHRPFIEALISTQLWQLFRSDCLEENVPNRSSEREDEVQLFCECVECTAASDGRPTGSCGDVLYPHRDVAAELELLVGPPPLLEDASTEADLRSVESPEGPNAPATEVEAVPATGAAARGHSVESSFDMTLDSIKQALGGGKGANAEASQSKGSSWFKQRGSAPRLEGEGGGGEESHPAAHFKAISSSFSEGFARLRENVKNALNEDDSPAPRRVTSEPPQRPSHVEPDAFWHPFGADGSASDDEPVPLPLPRR